jgi:hypothetical protein
MKTTSAIFPVGLALLVAMAVGPSQAQSPDAARTLFGKYQSLERSFDPAAADLYCDTALIRNTRTYPDGQKRTLDLPAPKYKELIRSAMPLAKSRSDYNKYSGVAYAPENGNVRITATRYSVLKQYASPLSLLVGPCKGGAWGVLEELSESRP